MPLLSVTLTSYNYADYLPTALDSILGQSFTDFELIAIDNASTDRSVEILRDYASRDERIRLVAHQQNQGALASLRESCDLSTGRYRVHVDADDWIISPTALEQQVDVFRANPGLVFVFSPTVVFDESGAKGDVLRPDVGPIVPPERAIEVALSFSLAHTGLMMRLDAYRAAGGYPDGLPHVDDTMLAVKMCEHGGAGYVGDELYALRRHGSNAHLGFPPDIVRDEYLPTAEAAFTGPVGSRIPGRTRRQILRGMLVQPAVVQIFNDRRLAAWRFWWASFKLHPWLTAFQRGTLLIAVRTIMGQRGFDAVERARRRVVHRLRA